MDEIRKKLGFITVTAAVLVGLGGCGDDTAPLATMDTGFVDMADAGTDVQMMVETDAGMPEPDAGSFEDGGEVHRGEITLGRLVIADAVEPELVLFDLDDELPVPIATFAIDSAGARVHGAKHGRYFYALHREAGAVEVFDSGLLFESHIDHYHLRKRDPMALDIEIAGVQPTHFTYHDGWSAIFYDGSGDVDFIQERSISAGSPAVTTASTGQAHHGVAVVTHGHLLATMPLMDEVLPVGVDVRAVSSPDSVEMEAEGCPSLHGEASAGEWTLFGCGDGVLALEFHDGHFDARKIDMPTGTPEEIRVGTVVGHEETGRFAGNYGDLGLVLIDPAGATMQTIETDAQVGSFTFDLSGEYILAWTTDGMLHRFSASTGDPASEPLEVTAAYEVIGHGSVLPSLAAGGARLYILDPNEARVREVHLVDWMVERNIPTGGAPFSMALVSLSPDYLANGAMHDDD